MDRIKRDNFIENIIYFMVVLSVALFILYPFLAVFREAFFKDGSINFESFSLFFERDIKLIKNSLMTGFLTVILTSILSISIALFIYFKGKKVEKIVFAFLMLTMISPPFVTSLSYIEMFGKRGFITHDILGLTLNTYGPIGIILMQSLGSVSLNTILILSGLRRIDPNIILSSKDLGASTGEIIRSILIPILKKTIAVSAVLTFVRSLADFSTPAIIGGSFSTLATEAYLNMIAYGNLNYASVINVVLFVPAFIAYLFYRKSIKEELDSTGEAHMETEMGGHGFLFKIITVISIFTLFWISIQYGGILFSAFTRKQAGIPYFTISNFVGAKPYLSQTLIRSLVYSFISAGLGSIIGLLIGHFLVIRKKSLMAAVDFISMMPYIIPGSFFGIGYILAFRSEPIHLTGTASIVVLNMLFRQLPFSSKLGVEITSAIPSSETSAVRDLGGTGINIFLNSVWANAKDNLAMAFANSFSQSMTTIGSIIFLVYPSQKVLTLVMFDAIQSGKYNVGSALAVVIILITATVNLLVRFILKRRRV